MPTQPIDPVVFGDTFAFSSKPDAVPPDDAPIHWDVVQHTETLMLGGATLTLQTSAGQRANTVSEGTWRAALAIGSNTLGSYQFPWCSPLEARGIALKWARAEVRKMMGLE